MGAIGAVKHPVVIGARRRTAVGLIFGVLVHACQGNQRVVFSCQPWLSIHIQSDLIIFHRSHPIANLGGRVGQINILGLAGVPHILKGLDLCVELTHCHRILLDIKFVHNVAITVETGIQFIKEPIETTWTRDLGKGREGSLSSHYVTVKLAELVGNAT